MLMLTTVLSSDVRLSVMVMASLSFISYDFMFVEVAADMFPQIGTNITSHTDAHQEHLYNFSYRCS